jgi:hypothetical protein
VAPWHGNHGSLNDTIREIFLYNFGRSIKTINRMGEDLYGPLVW